MSCRVVPARFIRYRSLKKNTKSLDAINDNHGRASFVFSLFVFVYTFLAKKRVPQFGYRTMDQTDKSKKVKGVWEAWSRSI